jgi:hypothetical protein
MIGEIKQKKATHIPTNATQFQRFINWSRLPGLLPLDMIFLAEII